MMNRPGGPSGPLGGGQPQPPAGGRIRVMIVDDVVDTRDSISKLLMFERDIEVVGQAGSGEEAIKLAKTIVPDIILMDINMAGMNGIAATEAITTQVPSAQIIIMSVQGEHEYMRQAMLAGAREFLQKPPSPEELSSSIRRVYQRRPQITMAPPVAMPGANPTMNLPLGTIALPTNVMPPGMMPGVNMVDPSQSKIVAVFCPKGGTGCTTISVNMAIAMKQRLHKNVVLVDGNLPFGDAVVLLNMTSHQTIYDAVPDKGSVEVDNELLSQLVVTHQQTGLPVLLAPQKPEQAEYVTPEVLKQVLTKLKSRYEYVVVDTQPSFSEATLTILDIADKIIVPVTLEMTALKNAAHFLELLPTLGYDPEKVMLVVNRNDGIGGIRLEDVEVQLKHKVVTDIRGDARLVTFSINQGQPFVVSNRENEVSRGIVRLAQIVTGMNVPGMQASVQPGQPKQPEKSPGLLSRLNFGRR